MVNPYEFADRMDRVVKQSLNIDRHEKSVALEVIADENDDPEILSTQDVTVTIPPASSSEEKSQTPPENDAQSTQDKTHTQEIKQEENKKDDL